MSSTIETMEEGRAALYGAREVCGSIGNIQHAIDLLRAAIEREKRKDEAFELVTSALRNSKAWFRGAECLNDSLLKAQIDNALAAAERVEKGENDEAVL